MPHTSPAPEPISHHRDLLALFENSEKPAQQWLIGVESEKFGVHAATGRALAYEGDFGVLRVLNWLQEQRGYTPENELSGGPTIALRKGGISITLEPGAQFELSAPAVRELRQVQSMLVEHLLEIAPISQTMSVKWLCVGFHPFAAQSELPWVPKQRYAIMREYLPKHGTGAHDMMRRTATVQGNFDYSDPTDALRKLVLSLRIGPLVNAWAANSPYVEGKASGMLSNRGDVWLHMEPARAGLLEQLWGERDLGYDDYVSWALDAPMFLVKREGRILDNSGQPFRDFLEHGFQGERATRQDWSTHVNSLFPEARLKTTLELRSVDSVDPGLATAVIALFTGLLYDTTALAGAEELLRPISAGQAQASRLGLVTRGLEAHYGSHVGFDLARELLQLARGGLERRARLLGIEDERHWLEPLAELVEERT
ncbi:MAG TPA: glutamate-cysteine ligase family protein, partial [Polyangiaceae bacterium]|nr:glutamate-cysteine ligase family protein [Polyangiaceae bacterium]